MVVIQPGGAASSSSGPREMLNLLLVKRKISGIAGDLSLRLVCCRGVRVPKLAGNEPVSAWVQDTDQKEAFVPRWCNGKHAAIQVEKWVRIPYEEIKSWLDDRGTRPV